MAATETMAVPGRLIDARRWSFAISAGAARAITALVLDRDPTPGAGIRISRAGTPRRSFLLSVLRGPQEDDYVLSRDGAVVFVEAESAAALDGKVLDVEVNPQGVALFSLNDDDAATGW